MVDDGIDDFARNSLASIGVVNGVDEIGDKQYDKNAADDLFRPNIEFGEGIVKTRINNVDDKQPAESEAKNAEETDAAMEVK